MQKNIFLLLLFLCGIIMVLVYLGDNFRNDTLPEELIEITLTESKLVNNENNFAYYSHKNCPTNISLDLWRDAACPNDEEWISLVAVSRGKSAKLIAEEMLLEIKGIGSLGESSKKILMTSLKVRLAAIERLLSWTVADIGANKGYLVTAVLKSLLGHKRDLSTGKKILPYSSRRLGLEIFKKHFKKNEYYNYLELCGACCDCLEPEDAPVVEKRLIGVERPNKLWKFIEQDASKNFIKTKTVDYLQELQSALEDAVKDDFVFRPQRVDIHAYEPASVNYKWLTDYFIPGADIPEPIPEDLENREIYLKHAACGIRLNIYGKAMGNTKEGFKLNPTSPLNGKKRFVKFPKIKFGVEDKGIDLVDGDQTENIEIVSIDEHLLPKLWDTSITGPMLHLQQFNDHRMLDILFTDNEGHDIEVAKGGKKLLLSNMQTHAELFRKANENVPPSPTYSVAAYQFEMHAKVNYGDIFASLSSPSPLKGPPSPPNSSDYNNYVCFFPTFAKNLSPVPRYIRITHGCFRDEYADYTRWINAMCHHNFVYNGGYVDIERFISLTSPSSKKMSHFIALNKQGGRVLSALVGHLTANAFNILQSRLHSNSTKSDIRYWEILKEMNVK